MERRLKRFRLFVTAWSAASIVLFACLWIGLAVPLPILANGGAMHWAVWGDAGTHVGPMLFVVYIVWSVFLIRAADDPWRHALFLDFTVWANLAHGLLMVVQLLLSPHDMGKMFTDVPWVMTIAIGIVLLRPDRGVAPGAPVRRGIRVAMAVADDRKPGSRLRRRG